MKATDKQRGRIERLTHWLSLPNDLDARILHPDIESDDASHIIDLLTSIQPNQTAQHPNPQRLKETVYVALELTLRNYEQR